jgi:hypothetical protein
MSQEYRIVPVDRYTAWQIQGREIRNVTIDDWYCVWPGNKLFYSTKEEAEVDLMIMRLSE